MGHRQVQAVQLRGMSSQPCIACGSLRFSFTASARPGVQFRHCLDCDTTYTYPPPTPSELDKQYSQIYYGPRNVKFVSALEEMVQRVTRWRAGRIDKMIKHRSRVLEIGCGRGLLLESLARLGHQCYGTERSGLAATRARGMLGVKIYTTPLEECGFQEGSFDLAILWHVLEHLEDPSQTFELLSQLLKAGGLLLLEVPNYSSIQSKLAGKHWFHLDTEHHLHHFSREGLWRLLHRRGFQILKTSTFSAEQCPYGALQSFLNMTGLPREQLYRLLKREIAQPFLKKSVHYALAALLTPAAACFSLAEALLGKGGVLRVTARKLQPEDGPTSKDAYA
jgi:SAM-dependent methyltransferase